MRGGPQRRAPNNVTHLQLMPLRLDVYTSNSVLIGAGMNPIIFVVFHHFAPGFVGHM